MKTKLFLSFLFLVAMSIAVVAQTDADREAVKRTALNYAEGWYEGNADKMESALSPDLAKRIANTNAQGAAASDRCQRWHWCSTHGLAKARRHRKISSKRT